MMNTITNFASDCAAKTLGVEKAFTDGCCGVVTEELQPDQIEASSVVTTIIEAIMLIIEKCNDKERFQKHVSSQTLFSRVVFRRALTANSPRLSFRGEDVNKRELSEMICQCASQQPETIASAVWDEVEDPWASI